MNFESDRYLYSFKYFVWLFVLLIRLRTFPFMAGKHFGRKMDHFQVKWKGENSISYKVFSQFTNLFELERSLLHSGGG